MIVQIGEFVVIGGIVNLDTLIVYCLNHSTNSSSLPLIGEAKNKILDKYWREVGNFLRKYWEFWKYLNWIKSAVFFDKIQQIDTCNELVNE